MAGLQISAGLGRTVADNQGKRGEPGERLRKSDTEVVKKSLGKVFDCASVRVVIWIKINRTAQE